MYILRIEHPIPDFDGWKKAFDSDPVGRQKSGVRRYRILRPIDDANYVMIDLEFDSVLMSQSCGIRAPALSKVRNFLQKECCQRKNQ